MYTKPQRYESMACSAHFVRLGGVRLCYTVEAVLLFLLFLVTKLCLTLLQSPGGSDSKVAACSAGDPGSVPGSGRSCGEGMATHSSTLAWKIPWTEDPWWATVHGIAKSQTRLSDFTSLSLCDPMD